MERTTGSGRGGQPVPPNETERVQLAAIIQRNDTQRTFIRWAGIVLVAFFGFQAAATLAGQSTNVMVSMSLSLLADLKFTVAITLAGAAAAWAVLERILRRRKVEYLQERIRNLEEQLDPNRTSSGLLPDGRTNPRDR